MGPAPWQLHGGAYYWQTRDPAWPAAVHHGAEGLHVLPGGAGAGGDPRQAALPPRGRHQVPGHHRANHPWQGQLWREEQLQQDS